MAPLHIRHKMAAAAARIEELDQTQKRAHVELLGARHAALSGVVCTDGGSPVATVAE